MKKLFTKFTLIISAFLTLTCYMYSATDTLSVTVVIPNILFVDWSPSSISSTAEYGQSDLTFDPITLTASAALDDGYTVQLTSSQASGSQFRLVHLVLPADTIEITVYSNQNPEGTVNAQTAIPANSNIIDVGEYPYSFTQLRTVTIVAPESNFTKDIAAGLYRAVITATISSIS